MFCQHVAIAQGIDGQLLLSAPINSPETNKQKLLLLHACLGDLFDAREKLEQLRESSRVNLSDCEKVAWAQALFDVAEAQTSLFNAFSIYRILDSQVRNPQEVFSRTIKPKTVSSYVLYQSCVDGHATAGELFAKTQEFYSYATANLKDDPSATATSSESQLLALVNQALSDPAIISTDDLVAKSDALKTTMSKLSLQPTSSTGYGHSFLKSSLGVGISAAIIGVIVGAVFGIKKLVALKKTRRKKQAQVRLKQRRAAPQLAKLSKQPTKKPS